MNALQTGVLVVLTANLTLIVFAVALLSVQKNPRRDQALLLATFLALYGLVKIHQIVLATGAYLFMPHLTGVVFPIMMLLGPTIYFYARSMTSVARCHFVPADAWFLVGILVVLALNAQYFELPAAEKIALLTHHASASQLESARMRCYLLYLVYLLFSGVCLVAAFRLFLRHTQRVRILFSNIENRSLAWLRTVLLILAAGWTWDVAGEIWSLSGGAPVWLSLATNLIEMGWIAAIAFFGVLQQPVFEAAMGGAESQAAEGEKYSRSALKQEHMIRIAAKLELAMTREKIFEDPELSLRGLSDHTGVSENYISQTLNDHVRKNFFDFVNGYRVAEACRRLETTGEPIVTIAFAVGFQSRSTFNAAFKRHAGTTPREHRAARANRAPASAAVPGSNGDSQVSV